MTELGHYKKVEQWLQSLKHGPPGPLPSFDLEYKESLILGRAYSPELFVMFWFIPDKEVVIYMV